MSNDNIDLPDNLLLHCPQQQFKLARVAHCPGCDHFSGLADRFPGSDKPPAQRYMLLCRHDPIRREMMEMVL